jgi:hypothetical protein
MFTIRILGYIDMKSVEGGLKMESICINIDAPPMCILKDIHSERVFEIKEKFPHCNS